MSPLWKKLRWPYDALVYYVSLFIFALWGVGYTLVSVALYRLLPRRTGARVGRVVMTFLFHSFLRWCRLTGIIFCDLSALDALRGEPGLIIAPNHPTLFDVVLVISRLDQVVCIAKARLWDNIILGGGARLAGYIRNDSPSSLVKLAVEELKDGRQLLIFPEGTRTRRWEGVINEFKGGFALIAKKAGAPVQTVFLEYNTEVLGKGWPLWKKPDFPLRYRARLGERFTIAPDEDVKDFVGRLERYYAEELRRGAG